MSRLIVFVLFLASLSYEVLTDDAKVVCRQLLIIKEASLEAANAVQNITIRSPQSKVQLAAIASDFLNSLDYAADSLNTAIPNAVNHKDFQVVVTAAHLLSNISNEIQQALARDSEILKEKLVKGLEAINKSVSKNIVMAAGIDHNFLLKQIKRELEFVIFGVNKLKSQSTLFDKSNEELITEMRSTISVFTEAATLLSNDKTAGEKLRRSLILTSVLDAKTIYKLENWVELNHEINTATKVIQEVKQDIASFYVKEKNATSSKHEQFFHKNEFVDMFDVGLNLAVKLANVGYEDNLGGLEYLRSSMFDFIGLRRALAENLKNVVEKP